MIDRLQKLALAGECGEVDAHEACREIAQRLVDVANNEVIYKAQIKNLHRLLGELVHRELGTPAHKASWDEARKVVLDAHMTEYKPGEVANND